MQQKKTAGTRRGFNHSENYRTNVLYMRLCMMLDIFLAIVCLASASLSAMSVPFKWGRYAVMFVQQKEVRNKNHYKIQNGNVPNNELN